MNFFNLFVRPFLSRMVREPAIGLSVWLAILAILATIHADVFEQSRDPLRALFTRPFARLFSPEPPSIDLSTLLTSPHRAADGADTDTRKGSLYIFALDLSGSMTAHVLSEQEAARYVEDSADTGDPRCSPQGQPVTGFDIAIFELCRYLDFVPDGSRAALWTFGDSPRLVAPVNDEVGSRYQEFLETETGGNTRKTFFEIVSGLESEERLSDFESLLRALAERYRDEIESDDDVHFVIVSDFSHDIGGGEELLTSAANRERLIERSRWQSRYRISALLIEEYFRKLSRPGKTFHLSVVLGARQVYCSVLPIAEDSIEWSAYREIRMHPERLAEDFDFLRSYEEVATPIVFYYTPGNLEPMPRRIRIDDASFQNARLRIAVASEAAVPDDYPLKLTAHFKDAEKGVVRMGRGHVGAIARADDEIVLQPLTTLTAREAGTYRLLFSLNNGRQMEDPLNKTFAVRLIFQKRLSIYGALAMVFAIAAVVVFGLWTLAAICYASILSWREVSASSQGDRLPELDPTQ